VPGISKLNAFLSHFATQLQVRTEWVVLVKVALQCHPVCTLNSSYSLQQASVIHVGWQIKTAVMIYLTREKFNYFPLNMSQCRAQSRMTSGEIHGGWSGTGADFSPSFVFPPLIVIPPLLHTHLSPPHGVCDSHDRAAHYHTIGPELGASSLTGTSVVDCGLGLYAVWSCKW
jgi:hypothetical protein